MGICLYMDCWHDVKKGRFLIISKNNYTILKLLYEN
jgi:hypothetical protein